MWVAVFQVLGHLPLFSQIRWQPEAGLETAAGLQLALSWDACVAGSGLTCCTTVPALGGGF